MPLKGIEYGIRALKIIEHLDWDYWILGDGGLKNSLTKLVKELKLDHKITFKGKVSREESLENIRSATIFLQPNVGPEGFGLSVAEALCLGTPAVAFNTPALDEIIESEKNGYLVTARDTKALSEAIKKLISDPEKRFQFSEFGKTHTPERFSDKFFLNATLALYKEIVTT